MNMNIESIMTALLASFSYAALFYVKNVLPDLAGKPLPEIISEMIKNFDFIKFASTLIVGMVVGLLVTAQGVTLTQENWELHFSLYAVYVITVEAVLKTLIRSIRAYRLANFPGP